MSDYALGLYVLNLWAEAAGIPSGAATVEFRDRFRAVYGSDVISEIGLASHSVMIPELRDVFEDMISGGASKQSPSSIDIKNGLLRAAGASAPSLFSSVVDAAPKALSEVAEGFGGSLKYVAIIAVVVAIGYVAIATGSLRSARP